MPKWAEVLSLLRQVERECETQADWLSVEAPEARAAPEVFRHLLAPLGYRPPPPWPPQRVERNPLYAWWGGAEPAEVVAFDIYPGYPGDGRAIPGLTDQQLADHARQGARWLRVRRTPWLRNYNLQLSAEMNRRGDIDG